jgi:hypothetical protein
MRMERPSHSPDLNPFESVCAFLKVQVGEISVCEENNPSWQTEVNYFGAGGEKHSIGIEFTSVNCMLEQIVTRIRKLGICSLVRCNLVLL